jgi:hypothetical protein
MTAQDSQGFTSGLTTFPLNASARSKRKIGDQPHAPNIIEAIKQRRVLRVFYDGHNRTVESHVYGINSAGHEAVSCYQVGGGSSSGKVEGWKMLLISKHGTVAMTEQMFIPRTSRSPWADNPMRQVYAQV